MRIAIPRLNKTAKSIAKAGYGELMQLFGPWVPLPQDFGSPQRERLFFPLTHLLALSRSGFGRRCIVPRGTAQFPGLARA
jgi:hypothetical protein